MNKGKTFNLIAVALTVAGMTIIAQISIPLPNGIPLTLQTLAIAFTGYLLGAKYGTIAVGVYISLGAVGAPVFSGFSGGFQKFMSPTGGFIWGFMLLALSCGMSEIKKWSKKERCAAVLAGTVGILLCHLCGIIQFASITGTNPVTAFIICSLPYLVKDLLCIIAAYILSCAIKKRYRSI